MVFALMPMLSRFLCCFSLQQQRHGLLFAICEEESLRESG
jgi:hypothetical protein